MNNISGFAAEEKSRENESEKERNIQDEQSIREEHQRRLREELERHDIPPKSGPLCHVNQIGYLPGAPKLAFVSGIEKSEPFMVRDTQGNSIFNGSLTGPIFDQAAEEEVWTADFSSLQIPGTYHLELSESGIKSERFRIGAEIYRDVWKDAMHGFVFSRCGVALDDSGITHPPCHLDDGRYMLKNGEEIEVNMNVTGGWHNGGDYRRSTITAALTVGRLLLLADLFPDRYNDGDSPVPSYERNDGIPDYFNEIRWGLDWLLKLQREDGGILQGIGPGTGPRFGKIVPPHLDDQRFAVGGVNSLCTARAGAAFAMAARILKKSDAPYAKRMLDAAVKCWDFLKKYPKPFMQDVVWTYPRGVFYDSKEYFNDRADRLWLAAELFHTTGGKEYNTYFISRYKEWNPTIAEYDDQENETMATQIVRMPVDHTAMIAYCLIDREGVDRNAQKIIIKDLENYADIVMKRIGDSGYNIALRESDWKHRQTCGTSLIFGMDLLMAGRLTGKQRYTEAALDQLNWILGRNPLDKVFVTGLGKNGVRRPRYKTVCHNQDELCPIGLLVKGPNDGIKMSKLLGDRPPLKKYIDFELAAACNEPDMEPHALFAFTAGYFVFEAMLSPE